MSDIIHLLPDSVANQIAAGEVIQRPASVIKELVENSIDAGATQVQVIVEDAGKSLVQVIDNGKGMSETDARRSFERHATSKIKEATDLFALRTMGFRGEALASIAAVAQVELRTRTESEELGTAIYIDASKVKEQTPVSCPVGANFAVRNLFFNIPARRKFLKTNQTELSNILTEFERIALAHPDIAFTLISGGNMMMNLKPGNFRQRIIGVYGRKIDAQLVPVEVDTPLVHIAGYVGTPAASRKKNAHQFFFTNGRYMRHPYFAKAVLTAFERLIGEGEQVPFFLNFEVAPAHIDVNIHPTKTEIKFEDDAAIWQILLAAIRESLNKSGVVPTIDFNTESRPDIPAFNPTTDNVRMPEIHVNPSFNPFDTSAEENNTACATTPHPDSELSETFTSRAGKNFNASQTTNLHNWQAAYDFPQETASPSEDTIPLLYTALPEEQQAPWVENSHTNNCLQYKGRYIITTMKSGIAVVDFHHASMRIQYDRYIDMLRQHSATSQRLLFPQVFTIAPSEQPLFETLLPTLTEIGFDLSPLGGPDYSVLATPTGTEGIDPLMLLSQILHDAIEGESNAAATVGHLIALTLARRVAMPVGQELSQKEMATLVAALLASETPNLTPDGHPTLAMITEGQIEKLFK